MFQEEQDANVAVDSSATDLSEAMAESTTVEEIQQAQEAQTPTAEQGETQEQEAQQEAQESEQAPFHQHPDWIRFRERKEAEVDFLKKQIEYQQQQAKGIPQPEQDPYANLPAEQKLFWQEIEKIADKRADAKVKSLQPLINATRDEIALQKVKAFRMEHPDVRPNSPEELSIAQKINLGYDPEDAYRSVMWDRVGQTNQARAVKTVQKKIAQKKQANVEASPSVSSNFAPKPAETISETFARVEAEMKKRGEL